MHANFAHLFGNMCLLLLFGLIVESKVAWWRMLAIYLGIGIASCGIEQFMMIFASGGSSLGASGVIYGLIAVTLIWAPENEITLTYVGVFFFRPFFGSFNVSIMHFCFFMIGVEFLIVWLTRFAMSSALLHLLGVVPGILIGVLAVVYRQVDCEGFDLISITQGRRGQRVITTAAEKENQQRIKEASDRKQREFLDGIDRVQTYIDQEQFAMAIKRFAVLQRQDKTLVMPENMMTTIIKGCDKTPATRELAIPLMQDYLKHYERRKVPISLMLARHRICVQERPKQGILLIRSIQSEKLNEREKVWAQRLLNSANELLRAGVLEVDES